MSFNPELTRSIAQGPKKKASKPGSPITKILSSVGLDRDRFTKRFNKAVPEYWDVLWDTLVEEGILALPYASHVYVGGKSYNVHHEAVNRKLSANTGMLSELFQVTPVNGTYHGVFQSSRVAGHAGFMAVIVFSSRDALMAYMNTVVKFDHRLISKEDDMEIIITPLSSFHTE